VVPNGVDTKIFKQGNSTKRDPGKIICVGRIEVRKNQLNLIRALNDSSYTLYIIGKPAPNHLNYYETCRSIASENIHFLEHVTDEELLGHYATAAVHVLPSRFETTGLSSLEAASMGCGIVVTACGDTREYFEDMVLYCDPESPASIFKAVEHAAELGGSELLKAKINSNYTWEHAAKATALAYKEVMG
jgi:glycosyltransferase involved in cell wall biosynthesis